jgi:tetratricopeptide (TPR) repeat protein
VIREGTAFLAQFPADARRVEVALAVADVYSRTNRTEKEFALYQNLLKELAARADGVPLGEPGTAYSKPVGDEHEPLPTAVSPAGQEESEPAPAAEPAAKARSLQYAQVLDRYLSRLVAMQKLPEALALLRGELDRNPQDPGLYEKLAQFLEQNSLNAHQEEVYQRAIDQFQDTSFGTGWYAKLARFYLRQSAMRTTLRCRARLRGSFPEPIWKPISARLLRRTGGWRWRWIAMPMSASRTI